MMKSAKELGVQIVCLFFERFNIVPVSSVAPEENTTGPLNAEETILPQTIPKNPEIVILQ